MLLIATTCLLLTFALPGQADEVSDRALQEVLRRYNMVTKNPILYRTVASRAGQSSRTDSVLAASLPIEMRALIKDLDGIIPPGPWVHAVSDKAVMFTAGERLGSAGKGIRQIKVQTATDDDGTLTVVTLIFHKGKLRSSSDVIHQIKRQTASLAGRIHIVATEAK